MICSAYIHTVHVDVVHRHLKHVHSANLGRPSIQEANLCQLQWDHDIQSGLWQGWKPDDPQL